MGKISRGTKAENRGARRTRPDLHRTPRTPRGEREPLPRALEDDREEGLSEAGVRTKGRVGDKASPSVSLSLSHSLKHCLPRGARRLETREGPPCSLKANS